tara:strand:- start:274 stop:732 length:459 start_codon:yes stop_codon:yes gene_type:complete
MRPGATRMLQKAIREKLERLEIDISNLELIKTRTHLWKHREMVKIHHTTLKIARRLRLALSYMHNGNEKKYIEYRDKAKASMSDELSLVMDLNHKIDVYRQSESLSSDEKIVMAKIALGPEGHALQQAEGMKVWDATFKVCEEGAEYIRHWN